MPPHRRPGQRLLDVIVALGALVLLSPLLLAVAAWIRIDSPGPVFFRQERVGQGGRLFRIHKFRTMVDGAARQGLPLTVGDDARITRAGGWLRQRRLDELPQFIDVLRGDMSVVGPRPEVPRYVAHYPPALRDAVLALRPGITDPSSLAYIDEASLLAAAPDPEREYIDVILPRKLQIAADYAARATMWTDLKVLAATAARLLR